MQGSNQNSTSVDNVGSVGNCDIVNKIQNNMTINSEQLNSNRNLNEKVTTLIDTLQNSNLNKKANKKPATSNLTNNYLMICNSIGYFLNNSTEIEVVNDSEHCTIICAKCKQFLNLPVFERESNFLMPREELQVA